MQNDQKARSIHIFPFSYWSEEEKTWRKADLPMALHPDREIWLDTGQVVYGFAELHISCEEICSIRMCAGETLSAIENDSPDEYEYTGQGRYPIMMGRQVLRFMRLRVHQPCFLVGLYLWLRTDEFRFPVFSGIEKQTERVWTDACSAALFCRQEGLWMQPSRGAVSDVYSVWILGAGLFPLSPQSISSEWKNDLLFLLFQDTPQNWLQDSPLASLWFFLALSEYYSHTKDEDFFIRHSDLIKSKLNFLLHDCLGNGRVQYPSEPAGSLWDRIFHADSEEILMAQQTAFFWTMSEIKHLIFHLGWMEQFVKIEHFLAVREEFWLFPQTSAGAALAVLGDLPDRRSFFLPQMRNYHYDLSPMEMILLVLAFIKKKESAAAAEIIEKYWAGKSAVHPPAAENPYHPLKHHTYMLSAWDAAPLNLIRILTENS